RYASEVGTTIEHTFTGYSISITHYTDNRGGVWKASIDGNFIKNISTYRYPSDGIITQLITDSLSNTEHTLTLEFIGQDPDNPVSSPRGWVRFGESNENYK